MDNNLAIKALQKKEFSVDIFDCLEKYEEITELLSNGNLNINRKTTQSKKLRVEEFNTIVFNIELPVMDMFLYCSVLKDYGLKFVQLMRFKADSKIGVQIGSTRASFAIKLLEDTDFSTIFTRVDTRTLKQCHIRGSKYSFLFPIAINDFLKIEPIKSIDELMREFKHVDFTYNPFETEPIVFIENNDEDSSSDNLRDSFYALTDGQYGSWEDFNERGGNMDDLTDSLGY